MDLNIDKVIERFGVKVSEIFFHEVDEMYLETIPHESVLFCPVFGERDEKKIIYALLENGEFVEVRKRKYFHSPEKEEIESEGESLRQFIERTKLYPVAWIEFNELYDSTKREIETQQWVNIYLGGKK